MLRSGHLRHLYLLLFTLLAATGLNAGWIATLSYDIVYTDFVPLCMANVGTTINVQTQQELLTCSRSASLPWAVVMLSGAVATLAVTALLVVAGGLWVRWQLINHTQARSPAVDQARQRFQDLCTAHGLERQPVLHVLRPGSRFTEAFTTGLPFGRPVVVLPLAVAAGPPELFRPIVHHELAHVEARDVTLAAAAWWSAWSSVAVLVVAGIPFMHDSSGNRPAAYAVGLGSSVVMPAVLILFRAHVLRLRELAADRTAADRSVEPAEVVGLLKGRWRSSVRPVSGVLRTVLSVHPGGVERARVLVTGTTGVEGGFLFSAATAMVLMICVQPVSQTSMNLFGWGSSAPPLNAVAGLLLGFLVLPVWVRRSAAAQARQVSAQWWGPALGLGVGAVVGYVLPTPSTQQSPGSMVIKDQWILAPLLFLVVCGVAWLLICLARDADPARRSHRVAATAAGAGIAAVTLSAALSAMMHWNYYSTGPGQLRGGLLSLRNVPRSDTGIPDWCIAVVFLAIAALAILIDRSIRGALRRLAPAIILIAAAVGSIITEIRFPGDPDTDRNRYLYLLWQSWWVAAAAGAVVLFFLVARTSRVQGRTPQLAVPLTAAAVVTLGTSLIQLVVRMLDARAWTNAFYLGEYAFVPLRELLLLSVVVTPVAVLTGTAWRRRPIRSPRVGRIAVAATTVIICAATMAGAAETVTGNLADLRRLEDLNSLLYPPDLPLPPPPTWTPAAERRLTAAEAKQAVAAAGRALRTWHRVEDEEPSAEGTCDQSAAEPSAPAPDPVIEVESSFAGGKETFPGEGADLFVTIESFRRPVKAADYFAPLRADIQRCQFFTMPLEGASDGKLHYRLSEREAADSTYPTFAYSVVALANLPNGQTITSTSRAVVTVIGYNVILVALSDIYRGTPPPFSRLKAIDRTTATVLLAVVGQIGDR
jgi:Zn-dependent protease with chaperone function